MQTDLPRVMFVYWGRRGLTELTHAIAETALADPRYRTTISVSRQNDNFATFETFGPALFAVDTFASNIGALTEAWRIRHLRRQLVERLRADRTDAVIELMPHVWSSLVMPAAQAAGTRYISIVHDANPHPGDYRTRVVNCLLDRSRVQADRLITLSDHVTAGVVASNPGLKAKTVSLFLPDIAYQGASAATTRLPPPAPGEPLRLLWLGRILPYKGLPLFLDAVEALRRDGTAVRIGIFGEGALGPCRARLDALGDQAEVVNRWITEAEIADALTRYHVVVLSHTEASQSAVAATALGAGLPIATTPVGGLVEQIEDGVTGVIAARVDGEALADAIKRLRDPKLFRAIGEHIVRRRETRSIARFVDEIITAAMAAKA
jgi:glycosyltransferase involved in cell wall biosynthesis